MTSQSLYYSEIARRQAKYVQPKQKPPYWHWFALGIFLLLFLLYCYNYLQTNQDKILKIKTEQKH